MWFLLEEWDVIPYSGSHLAMWCEDILPGGLRWQPQGHSCCPHTTQPPCHPPQLLPASIWLLLTEGSFPQLQKGKPVQGHVSWMWPRQMGLIGACRHPIKSSSTHPQEGRMTCSLELAGGKKRFPVPQERGIVGRMDNSPPGSIVRITPERATDHLVTVTAVAGEILGIKQSSSYKVMETELSRKVNFAKQWFRSWWFLKYLTISPKEWMEESVDSRIWGLVQKPATTS